MVSLPVATANDRVSLPALAREQGVSPVSTWRWALRGCAGIVLPTFCIGHKRYTTRAAFADWVAQVTVARNGEIGGRAPAQRESAIERAERETARLGV
ncbi:MAG: DUF1580 domain-containing protein [Pirellulales bacterium]|nr:DUF1580 domain-containing protein [Pirellulales bacterium]